MKTSKLASGYVLRVLIAVLFAAKAFAQETTVNLVAGGARPVDSAIKTLLERYPQTVVTYEDPPFEYGAELRDVTLEVRNDLHLFAPGKTPKVLVPLGGNLQTSYVVSADGKPSDWAATLQNIIEAQNASAAGGGRFRLEQTGDIFHVVPTAKRDTNGNWVSHDSVLDRRISIPAKELRGVEMVFAICEAVGKVAGIKVTPGGNYMNTFSHYEGTLSANNERARDVLSKLFVDVSKMRPSFAGEQKLGWALLYDLGPEPMYVLNIRGNKILRPDHSAARQPARPSSGGAPFRNSEAQ